MTYEEMERTMQFILNQQAQISANVQRHDEYLSRIEANMDRLEANMEGLEDVVLKLANSHVLLVNSHKELEEAFRRLAEAQAETQERLDAFIVSVEKYISSRNGDQRPAQ